MKQIEVEVLCPHCKEVRRFDFAGKIYDDTKYVCRDCKGSVYGSYIDLVLRINEEHSKLEDKKRK